MISDGICTLFKCHDKIGRNKMFTTYGDVHSVSDLRCAIDELYVLLLVTVSIVIVINSSYCLEVVYLVNVLFICHLRLFLFLLFFVVAA